ncbi:MAG: DUF2510 domain-containing protein [Acidimicrobiia bacterium]|nr:DUF2510 domain-containing protein [Acidimicrobiia bacterium]
MTASWHPDPFRRHELRFHDGQVWTEHVADRGVSGIDTVPVADGPRSRPPDLERGGPPSMGREAARIVPDVGAASHGLLDSPVLLVEEPVRGTASRAGLDCAVFDQRGTRLGTVRTAREPLFAKLLRMLTSSDRRDVTRVDVLDPHGVRLVRLDRPAWRLKPRVTVTGPSGAEIGEIVPRMAITRLLLTLEAAHQVLGVIEADRHDGSGARVNGPNGQPVARTARTWEVLAALQHPDAGTHVVEVAPGVAEPLRTLAVAALLASDTMFAPSPQAPEPVPSGR